MAKENEAGEEILNEIFVDKNEPADKKLLIEILKPFVTIDSEGIISFSKEFENLKESKKALVYLLCKKAMVLKGIEGINEPTNLAEVVKQTMISESNGKNALFTYYKGIVKKEGKGYMIPNYNLKRVKEIILKKDKK